MRLHRCRFLVALAVLGAVSSLTPAVQAQSDEDRATARELGQQGFAALDGKDYKVAEDRLRRADKLVHAPTLLLGLARALAGQHKFVEAQETYQRIIREGVPPGAPEAFKNALEAARSEVSAVAPLLGGVTIVVTAAGGGTVPNLKVSIDGTPVNAASLGVRRLIDPGPHVINVTADGYRPAEARIAVAEGGTADAPVKLEKDPNWVAPTTAPTASVGTPAPTDTGAVPPVPTAGGEEQGGGIPSYVPWIGFGVGAAGLILGGVTGAIALGDHSTLAKACTNGSCGSDQQSKIDSYHTMGALSTTGFIVGGVGVAAGAILFFLQPKSTSSAPATQPPPATGLHVTPVVGIGSLGAVGTF